MNRIKSLYLELIKIISPVRHCSFDWSESWKQLFDIS